MPELCAEFEFGVGPLTGGDGLNSGDGVTVVLISPFDVAAVLFLAGIIGKNDRTQILNIIGPIILNHLFADGINTGILKMPKSDPDK